MADEGRKRKMQRKKGANLMKNLFKKIGALLVAAVMVLSMCTAVFAENGDMKGTTPSVSDTGKVTISGVAAGDTVTLYKIVKANYNDNGFYGYSEVVNNTIADKTTFVPTAKEISALANNATITATTAGEKIAGSTTVEFDGLAIGSYLVKVTAGNGNITVYNPMVVSVSYVVVKDTTKVLYGEVSADDNYTIGGTVAYVKSSKNTTPDKNIIDTNGKVIVNGVAAGKGDAVAKGDTVNYKITGTIPSYNPDYYTTPSYVIYDEISNGLDFAADTQTSLQNQANAAFGKGNATVEVNNKKITITLDGKYILSLAGKNAEERSYAFTYSAVLNGRSVNFDASTNKVYVNYTNKPGKETDSDKVTTNHYTFKFNGEVVKVDEADNALAGAVFGLFTDPECTTKATYGNGTAQITATSVDTGAIEFTGLDDKVYYMKEIATPSSEYKLNNTVYKIEFKPTFSADGKMSEYTVTVTDLSTNKVVSNTYTPDKNGNAILKANSDGTTPTKQITEIKNTKLGTLPSTGGMGTYLFTIIGVVVMAGAAGVFFISRRKGSEE